MRHVKIDESEGDERGSKDGSERSNSSESRLMIKKKILLSKIIFKMEIKSSKMKDPSLI